MPGRRFHSWLLRLLVLALLAFSNSGCLTAVVWAVALAPRAQSTVGGVIADGSTSAWGLIRMRENPSLPDGDYVLRLPSWNEVAGRVQSQGFSWPAPLLRLQDAPQPVRASASTPLPVPSSTLRRSKLHPGVPYACVRMRDRRHKPSVFMAYWYIFPPDGEKPFLLCAVPIDRGRPSASAMAGAAVLSPFTVIIDSLLLMALGGSGPLF
ncbi:MAG: hypothetical protein JW909_03085 [Planctomycetes bacterium]|nr:hypothetical protein [Planctomycetota bacterium]